ncbi:MAG: hypothetical protein ACOY0T_06815 [Myxococcota bacterium]
MIDPTPERPAAVPSSAHWSEEDDSWVDGSVDAEGRRHGEYRCFRANGSLRSEIRFDAGVRSGPFRFFHPSGELAREGQFVNGAAHGLVVAYHSDSPNAEGLRACCVPGNARRMQAEYDRGCLLAERFFDAEGRLLLSDGRVAPKRPDNLPAQSQYDEFSDRWLISEIDGARSWVRFFDANGLLLQEDTFGEQRRERIRLFAADGSVRKEEHFDPLGRLHGERHVRYDDSEASPYAVHSIVEEFTRFEADEPIGVAKFVHASGQHTTLERGRTLVETDLGHEVFTAGMRESRDWAHLADELAHEGNVRLSICAAARAAARANSLEPLQSALARHVMPLAVERARELGERLGGAATNNIGSVLSALLSGAEPAFALRALAKLLPRSFGAPAALDFVEAALLLAPDDAESHWIRAMGRLELGHVDAALADAERVALTSPPLAGFIRDYVRYLFQPFIFRAPEADPSTSFEGLTETPLQPIAAIRRVIRVYATRLLALRNAAQARLGTPHPPEWLPPTLSHLLPDGPIELLRYRATIVDTSDEGEETSEVEIDETLDLTPLELQELQLRARSDWAALCALSWVAGLDDLQLPDEMQARSEFTAAASTAIARAARLTDLVATGGLRARSQGVPGFAWEGVDIDSLPPAFARIACEEYLELRSLFLWLCFEENHSPFQSDLRLD